MRRIAGINNGGSDLGTDSNLSRSGIVKHMRVSDPIGGAPDLDRFFQDYERHFKNIEDYSFALRHLIARYSRGDSMEELRGEFSLVLSKVAATEKTNQRNYPGTESLFVHRGRFLESFLDALILLSFGLCLRAPREEIVALLSYCERGDPLLEAIAGAAAPGIEQAAGSPAFYETFDLLYDALRAGEHLRQQFIREYLDIWYSVKMDGLSMKDTHLTEDRSDYVGYWCFEAAGVVAALSVDDRTFANHPHYPRDLVAFYSASAEAQRNGTNKETP
jgi:hypothetical protein